MALGKTTYNKMCVNCSAVCMVYGNWQELPLLINDHFLWLINTEWCPCNSHTSEFTSQGKNESIT